MSRLSVFRSRFFWKIYSTFSVLFLSTTLLVSWIVFFKVQSTIKEGVLANLRDKAAMLVPAVTPAFSGDPKPVRGLIRELGKATASRITLIAPDGGVIADSDHVTQRMENHLQRPEVQQAIQSDSGRSERFSATGIDREIYLAQAIRAGGALIGVVRVSVPGDRIDEELASLQLTIGLIACGGVILALAIGWTLAKRVAVPISEMVQVAEALRNGRYEQKVRTITNDEIGRLGDTLNRLGAELTNKISELHRLENVRRDFVANVSHEIKTPLTSIKGYVETLLGGAIEDPVNNVRFLEKIDRNASRLAALVQDILSLAKIEAGEDLLKPIPIEWNPIVSSVIARHEDAVQQKNLRIKVAAPTAPLTVLGDKEAMTQVLDNLLSNAIKYTPEGGRITVSLLGKSSWGKLEVEDTGIGIPPEHLDRIFERFYRVDKARSRELGGTGLGLSIVKHLVSGMNGEIGVESAVGVGSRFTVRLRLAAAG
jgi:two-component system phosphate regulon sensor histidine kinase PhoR